MENKTIHEMKWYGDAFKVLTSHHGWAVWAPGYGWIRYGFDLQAANEFVFCYNFDC